MANHHSSYFFCFFRSIIILSGKISNFAMNIKICLPRKITVGCGQTFLGIWSHERGSERHPGYGKIME